MEGGGWWVKGGRWRVEGGERCAQRRPDSDPSARPDASPSRASSVAIFDSSEAPSSGPGPRTLKGSICRSIGLVGIARMINTGLVLQGMMQKTCIHARGRGPAGQLRPRRLRRTTPPGRRAEAHDRPPWPHPRHLLRSPSFIKPSRFGGTNEYEPPCPPPPLDDGGIGSKQM